MVRPSYRIYAASPFPGSPHIQMEDLLCWQLTQPVLQIPLLRSFQAHGASISLSTQKSPWDRRPPAVAMHRWCFSWRTAGTPTLPVSRQRRGRMRRLSVPAHPPARRQGYDTRFYSTGCSFAVAPTPKEPDFSRPVMKPKSPSRGLLESEISVQFSRKTHSLVLTGKK